MHSTDSAPATRSGFLLSRSWRDTDKGLELEFWLQSDQGPIQVLLHKQKAVCFIDRDQDLATPAGVTRKSLNLRRLGGGEVDGLYFDAQRTLADWRASDRPLIEADIRPTERYLMERFITAGVAVQGYFERRGNHWQVLNPRLQPAEHDPSFLAASIDIETHAPSGELYSIAADCRVYGQSSIHARRSTAPRIVFMRRDVSAQTLPPTSSRNDYQLQYCAGERAVLEAFIRWLQVEDPDLLLGWNVVNFDLRVMEQRCQALGVEFNLGRDLRRATVRSAQSHGLPAVALIPGRAVLDGVDQLRAGFWPLERYGLEHVAQALLGEGKRIDTDKDKVAEIIRLYHEKPEALADYNHQDTVLVSRIFEHAALIPFAIERARLTGLAIDRLGGSVAAFDNLYLPRLHRQGFVAPLPADDETGLGSPGGHVLDSQPGLYRNVLLLDFKSLYPSIIRTFCIDPLGLSEPGSDPVDGFLGAQFSREQHILPGLIESLWAARDKARRERNTPLSQAIKIIMNSFYGVLGSSGCRFHRQQLASSITLRGHEIITRSRTVIEQRGMRVIYGDTDSLFVWLDESLEAAEARQQGLALASELNQWWRDTLRREHRLESALEIEFETLFSRFLMPTLRGTSTGSKKRYAGWLLDEHQTPTLVIKGLEAVRTDWTPLARRFQRELLECVFRDEDVIPLVLRTDAALRAGELDDELVYRKRLRRPLDDYTRNVPPHVQAARKLERPSRWVSYLITHHGPEPLGHATAAPDYEHYRERQLAPVADTVLQFKGANYASLTDAQMSMF